ncbi:MAG TPA: hypothetical protein VKE24_10905 [Candidatus Acidoferrales bacterium]|nr:hypothetical protein [Candidatus Acidoferrales bacterium]
MRLALLPKPQETPRRSGRNHRTALPSGNCGYTADDIYDRACLTVQNDHVRPNGSATVDYWQPWQAALKIWRKWLHALLQTRRKRAIALQMLLESRRQVSIPLCQSRWETRASRTEIGDDYLTIALAEDGPNLILTPVIVPSSTASVLLHLILVLLFVRITLAASLDHTRQHKRSKSGKQ